MTALAQEQASKLRVARRALVPAIGGGFVPSVPGHRVTRASSLSVRPNQNLQPLQIYPESAGTRTNRLPKREIGILLTE
jgi:hypothetical protein